LLRCDSPDSEIERLLEEWPLIPTHESKFIWRRQKQGILRIPLHNMHGNDLHFVCLPFFTLFLSFWFAISLFLLMFKHKREYQDFNAINLLCFYSFSPFFKKTKTHTIPLFKPYFLRNSMNLKTTSHLLSSRSSSYLLLIITYIK